MGCLREPQKASWGAQVGYGEWESPCRHGDAGDRGPHCAKAVEGLGPGSGLLDSGGLQVWREAGVGVEPPEDGRARPKGPPLSSHAGI